MKVWKRSVAWLMCLLMAFGLMGAYVPAMKPKAARAEDVPFSKFTKEEFLKCYTKLLVEQLGHSYAGADYTPNGTSSGYVLGGVSYNAKNSRITSGTPYEPLSIAANQTFDCDGLVLTCLMAMGYDYFEGSNGKKYYLNGYYGGGKKSDVNLHISHCSFFLSLYMSV